MNASFFFVETTNTRCSRTALRHWRVTTDLGGVGVEDAWEAVPAVLVEEDGADEEQDGEASCHRGVLDGEDADRDHLRQDQGEHYGVVHDRPQLAPHFVLWVVHIQDLQDSKLIKVK